MNEIVLENGLDIPKLAMSCLRVFFLCSRGKTSESYDEKEMADLVIDNGWASLAVIALSYYAASDDENIALTVAQLTAQMRNAYYRGRDDAEDGPATPPRDFETLPVRERLAWEMVARHAAWATNADEDDIDSLERHEVVWPDLLPRKAAERRLELEPVEEAATGRAA